MAREDWQDRDAELSRQARRDGRDFGQADYSADYGYDPQGRNGYRVERNPRPDARDYGQADYSTDYAYDPDGRRAYRREAADDAGYRQADPPRSWMDRVGAAFVGPGPRGEARPARARRGPSDRVLWAVIVERLEDERGIDLRDVEVIVEDAEVTLNGTVKRKADKRRIEDVADISEIRHVQNNLRVRDHHWTFF